jgi:NADPH-dependent 2,4-dienoyl-CoA reductase/sulfur reductase-like enzyme
MGNNVCKEDLEKKHVVVIGGGYGGMELASELLKLGIPFTLIDPKVTREFDFAPNFFSQ